MNELRRGLPLLVAGLIVVSCAHAQENGIFKRLRGLGGSGLDESTIDSGLREALRVGIERTVASVGREDGYFANPDIKIPPPRPVQRVDGLLRGMGYGPAVDEFVLSMNRAAEQAAPLAQDIFVDSISAMTIDDARNILRGSESEATDYLREHSTDRLVEAFSPIVSDAMAEYDVSQRFAAVTRGVERVPFAREQFEGSIEEYTVNMALEGLFFVLAQEEKRIRENPAARTTDLLKKVFGER